MRKAFGNLNVGVKLISGFVLVALIAGIVGVVGILNLNKINKNYTDLYINYGIASSDIGKISTLYQRSRVNLRDILLEDGSSDRGKYADNIKAINEEIPTLLSKFEKTLMSDQAKATFASLKANMDEYTPIEEKILGLALSNQGDQAFDLLEDSTEIALLINDQIQTLFDMKVADGQRESEANTQTTNSTVTIMLVIVVIAMIVAVLLGIVISRMISNPVKKLVGAANRLAEGDLDVEIEAATTDEVGVLSAAFKKMANNINDVMGNIASAAEQVTAGAKQVSDSSVALSQGATEQASSVEQLTASLEEISAQTTQNAGSANQANQLAESAKKNAVQGNEQMKEMLKAMDEINEASNNISRIIKVIDEIAFQTNILALNAAVEAARAGQHGKGFAVVAEEVRNLAARSANAAKETTAMIEGSIRKVEGGTRIANETAAALNQIVDGVAQVATLVHEIATASNEQAIGISQVNQGIIQVSSVVQTNSATSEESAAASEELSGQAIMLKEQVSRFRLRRQLHAHGAADLEALSPEMIRVLENMKSLRGRSSPGESYEESAVPKYRIQLSDQEFGKY
ncbi:methyl-accepting chemotaxis protein [Cohnella cellulosilytica]|uniref:Methyl-accepting chemotaxis protein n=1 Tax=Cohnella cellulosilytica TaxID=986710 RepID=A0ABW2FFX2_9BACL